MAPQLTQFLCFDNTPPQSQSDANSTILIRKAMMIDKNTTSLQLTRRGVGKDGRRSIRSMIWTLYNFFHLLFPLKKSKKLIIAGSALKITAPEFAIFGVKRQLVKYNCTSRGGRMAVSKTIKTFMYWYSTKFNFRYDSVNTSVLVGLELPSFSFGNTRLNTTLSLLGLGFC